MRFISLWLGLGVGALPLVAAAGDLQNRMDLTLRRVLHGGPPAYTEDFVLADAKPVEGRLFTDFSGDVSGRYLGALATVAEFKGEKYPELDRIAAAIVKVQKPDGHFGNPFGTNGMAKGDMPLAWGNGRLLIGLLEYYRLNPSPAVLECARRLGDCLVAVGPRFNNDAVRQKYSGNQGYLGYICWTQIIEGLVELSRVTHDKKYLTLAAEVASNTERIPKQHSHGFVSSLRGILELYRVTHDPQWLKKVETEWEGIVSSGNLLPHGALPEVFKPGIVRDEGCSEADWVRFNLSLWAETRHPRYLENAELTLFNEFYFNQFRTGDFGHHVLTANGVSATAACAWWCCTFHGLRAFPEILRSAFHADGSQLCYDLPVDGAGVIGDLKLQANSTLERDATVTLTVISGEAAERVLRLRQPAWASALELQLNGQALKGVTQTNAVEVRRRWQTGDMLVVRYALRNRLMKKPDDDSRVAIWRGPWLLGVNEQNEPAFFNEPMGDNRISLPPVAANGDLPLAQPPYNSSEHNFFRMPAAHLVLPYLQGGYPMQPQTVTLRPIAEHANLDYSTPWTWWLKPQ
jgi:DUF1680 family protein